MSGATFGALGDEYIRFGILHCIAASMLLGPLFVRLGLLNVPLGAAAIWDTLIRNLENQNWILFLLGVAAAIFGAVIGDYQWATALRQSLAERADSSATQSALQRYARERTDLLRIVGVGVGILLLLVWPEPSLLVAFIIIGLTALYLIGVEYLRKEAEAPPAG